MGPLTLCSTLNRNAWTPSTVASNRPTICNAYMVVKSARCSVLHRIDAVGCLLSDNYHHESRCNAAGLGHRYFLCAQAQSTLGAVSATPSATDSNSSAAAAASGIANGGATGGAVVAAAAAAVPPTTPTYRESTAWLDFQFCSYGQCQECDVFTELFCLTPCSTYTSFTKPTANHIMQDCAVSLFASF
jgi:hypothetical protein